MQIDESFEQPTNARLSIRETFDPNSSVTSERFEHPLKQLAHRISTDAGMEMAESDEQPENALSSIRDSLDPDSNVTVDSLKQPRKQLEHRT
jgi:hypothetical protein